MTKERYDILVAALLIISVCCVGLQTLFPFLMPVALTACTMAIIFVILQMRSKPMARSDSY